MTLASGSLHFASKTNTLAYSSHIIKNTVMKLYDIVYKSINFFASFKSFIVSWSLWTTTLAYLTPFVKDRQINLQKKLQHLTLTFYLLIYSQWNRHLCMKTTVLSCRRCLLNTGVEKMNNILILTRILSTRCLQVKGKFWILTTVYDFQSIQH
jgi:hypothetical protein